GGHGPVLPDGEAHPGTNLHCRAEREIQAELEIDELPAAEAAVAVRGADLHLLVPRAEADPGIGCHVPQRMPVDLAAKPERARGAAAGADRCVGGPSEPVGEVGAQEPRASPPRPDSEL